jgi:endoglucanase
MAAAAATTTLRVGALVFDNDYKHPLIMAKELATLDVLSDGRTEIGMGAGWMVSDYEQAGIPYRIQSNPSRTATDADAIHTARAGVATAVISIPNRYMHSPNEMIDINDALNAARLIAAFVRRLNAETSFVPR